MKSSRHFLMGIDLGTSSTKTVIVDCTGKILSQTARGYEIDRPQAGYAEQNPLVWVQTALITMRTAVKEAGIQARQLSGIGIAGQMHSTVCLDRQGTPIRPAIIWADQRSQAQVTQVYKKIGRRRLAEWTANPLATGFMLASWLWLRENEPRTIARLSKLILPKDYLRYWLIGKLGSEPSDASSTLLFDTARRNWSNDLLSAFGLSPDMLPEIHESSEIAGGLTTEAAAMTGLLAGTPVIFGGSDQALQALGHGIVESGLVSCTIGSGGQLFAPTNQPLYDPHLRLHLFCHVLPELWHLEAAILSAGLSLKWLRDSLYPSETYQSLADAASQAPAGAEGLFFLPHLTGERTPHMDPQAKAVFFGLTLRHGRGHLARAVMEGVVMGLKRGLDLMQELGVPLRRVVASGGGVRHPLWLQLQADIFNQPIHRSDTIEAAAVGAAILAGAGLGIFSDAASTSRALAPWTEQVIQPIPENARFYEECYRLYCQLYPALNYPEISAPLTK